MSVIDIAAKTYVGGLAERDEATVEDPYSFYFTDHLGSTMALYDESKDRTGGIEYTAYSCADLKNCIKRAREKRDLRLKKAKYVMGGCMTAAATACGVTCAGICAWSGPVSGACMLGCMGKCLGGTGFACRELKETYKKDVYDDYDSDIDACIANYPCES